MRAASIANGAVGTGSYGLIFDNRHPATFSILVCGMTSNVFVIDKQNVLSALSRTEYESEDLFQRLLSEHPQLLGEVAGNDGRLLLVQREAPVPDGLTGSGRWSLDHLFLDNEGVPVLVEVKRATDTRVRREVVAQMLDYAANGIAYWPIDHIVSAWTSTTENAGNNPEEVLGQFLESTETEGFWRQVESNLKSGRIRMVFVADRIPKELRRIVEFLNEQMRPAEVLALEVEQYATSDGLRMLTPRLIGRTERAATAKAVTASGPQLTIEEWLVSLGESKGVTAESVARKLIAWGHENQFETVLTDSGDSVAFSITDASRRQAWPFFVRRSTGKIETALQYLASTKAFGPEDKRLDLLARLKSIPGASISTSKSTARPAVPLDLLAQPELLKMWTDIAEYVRNELLG